MHYQRAFVDREATRADGPIRFIAATEGRKADGIDLRMSGARLERFRSNPVFLYGHRYNSREDLPVGRAVRADIDGDRLMIDVEFDTGDPFATELERKYRGGFMNAVSIGFGVCKWEGDAGSYWAGGVAEEWELHELSAVPVPMDADAVVAAGRSVLIEQDRPLMRALVAEFGAEAIVRALGLAPEPKTGPEPPAEDTPPARGVNQDAAEILLAAFSLEGNPHE